MTNQIQSKRRVDLHTNFWQTLRKPFFVLSPMANVTDFAFREMITKYGKPDVIWTEFVSADGLISVGKKRLLIDLKYSNKERPIVAQLFTGSPESMRKAAVLITELGFDGLDINMGCPDRSVEKQGGGAAMMKNPELAIEIIKAAKEGVGEISNDKIQMLNQCQNPKSKLKIRNIGIPVSVKTRIGYNKIDMDWIRLLLEQRLPVLTVHLRTRKEMSEVPAHWELMPKIIEIRDRISPETLIIGNGDIETVKQGLEVAKKYGCDGVMIGRGIFGKPWLFSGKEKTPKERLEIMIEHARLYEKTFKKIKSFDVMKKHFKAYVSGWDGAKELRIKLMGTKNAKDVSRECDPWLHFSK